MVFEIKSCVFWVIYNFLVLNELLYHLFNIGHEVLLDACVIGEGILTASERPSPWEADPSQRFPDPPPQLHPALRERQRQDRRAAKERRAAKQEQTANGGREGRAPLVDHRYHDRHAAVALDPNELPFRIDGPPDLGPDGFPGSRFGSPPEIVF